MFSNEIIESSDFFQAIAAKVALKSALTAPFKIFKTKLAIKLAGFKALKALKLAKIAKTVAILKNLKKSPIILPVPVPLPLPVLKGLPSLPSLPSFPNPFAAPATTPAPVQPNPIDGALTTATKAFQAASAGLPLISALQNTFGQQPAKEVVQEVTPAPVYRFVPEVGFTNYNKVSYQPRLEVEVPAPINYYSSYPVEPLFPVARYAQVAQVLPAQQLLPAAGVIQAAPFGAVPAEVYGPPAK